MSKKRFGIRLRKLKSTYVEKVADGKLIGGQGRLTGKMIDTMQNYYSVAIHQSKNNLAGMQNDVFTGIYDLASSNDTPQQHLCPPGKES